MQSSLTLRPGSVCTVVGNFINTAAGYQCTVSCNGALVAVLYDVSLDGFMKQMVGKQIQIQSCNITQTEPRYVYVTRATQHSQGAVGGSKLGGQSPIGSGQGNTNQYRGAPAPGGLNQALLNPTVPPTFPPFRPIADLTYYCNSTGWTILGRVTRKSPLRTFRTQKDVEGSMFSFILTDAGGEGIQCKGFTDFCANYEKIQEGGTYFFSGGKIEQAKRRFNQTSHECEITFDRNTKIATSTVEVPPIVNIVPINSVDSVQTMQPGSLVDIVCVVRSVGAKTELMTKTNKTLLKTEARIVDHSGCEVALTFWGDDATKAETQLSEGTVIAVKNCKVSEFKNSKQLSVSGDIIVSPQLQPPGSVSESIIEKALFLNGWYQVNKGTSFRSLSTIEGTMTETSYKCLPIKTVMDERIGLQEREYFSIRAHIMRITRKNLFYLACSKCGGKMMEDSNHCEQCGVDVVPTRRFSARIVVADDTGEMFLTAFDQQARAIFQKSADDVSKMVSTSGDSDGESSELYKFLDRFQFKEYLFRCSARNSDYLGAQRIKYTMFNSQNINFANAAKECWAEIMRYQK